MKGFKELKIDSFFDEEELKKIIRRRIKIPQEKIKNVEFKSSPRFFKNGTSYHSNFREKIYNNRGSSFNMAKATAQSEKHSTRTEEKEPKYFLPQEYRQENEFWNCGESEQDIFNRELETYKREHKGGRIPKFENCKWEAIINLNHTHTMDDAQKVAEYIAQKFNFTATRIAIHRDEGHFETDENGEKCVVYNYHAHLNFITLKNARQNMRREHISAKDLSQAQDEIAEILKMERGERLKDLYGEHYHETKATKKHKNGREYAQEQKALELTKKEISAEIEKIRKDSKEKGYTQEYFKALSNLKRELLQEQSIKIHDLNEILENFKREQDKIKAENLAQAQKIAEQEQKIKELEKQNADLKAELALKTQETALKTQNEPKPSQDINQSEKTQENAQKETSQNQKDLEKAQKFDKNPFLDKTQAYELKSILKRLNLEQDIKTLENAIVKSDKDKISTPYDITQKAISKLQAEVRKENEKKILERLNNTTSKIIQQEVKPKQKDKDFYKI